MHRTELNCEQTLTWASHTLTKTRVEVLESAGGVEWKSKGGEEERKMEEMGTGGEEVEKGNAKRKSRVAVAVST